MLDFSKTILKGVSFSEQLFSKELRKLIAFMGDDKNSIQKLKEWCSEHFGKQFPDAIAGTFGS
ncbi:MAG: hypothetical protein A2W91_18385 [Bacteroidetes bacterium GWF2_38_335]|nr:MAG: hypothetical protein A2W91_18385 [Bacteroidetes bacterium GWF2_38_335]OFY80066.1 MAG: hypothetical protein A2281_12250 [Bacteroidetes bacterium RIFOXYA12_FULL_38_20]HBS88609.1 hypothetical protein [Bacteroidales bacterium]